MAAAWVPSEFACKVGRKCLLVIPQDVHGEAAEMGHVAVAVRLLAWAECDEQGIQVYRHHRVGGQCEMAVRRVTDDDHATGRNRPMVPRR